MLEPVLAAYEAAVAPWRPSALTQALDLGKACISRASWLTKALESEQAREPTKTTLRKEQVWRIVTEAPPSPITTLFRILHTLYSTRTYLKAYQYAGVLQIQVCPHHLPNGECATNFAAPVLGF